MLHLESTAEMVPHFFCMQLLDETAPEVQPLSQVSGLIWRKKVLAFSSGRKVA